MATAKIVTNKVEVVKIEEIKSVTLNLTMEEAQVLVDLTGGLSGLGANRNLNDKIYNVLTTLGFRSRHIIRDTYSFII